MSPDKYTIGIDFGTLSGRAVLVRVSDGAEIASAVSEYSNGVIDERLPESGVRLEPDWALQDPDDYIRVFAEAIPAVLRQSGVSPDDVIGLGIDFTACTMLPTKADGTPLCRLPEFRANPHAWVKLWKHHAAQPEADRVNAVAAELGETWLPRYGGKISSEWFFPKALQILNEAPEVYEAADRLIEAADWVVWQLTGVETRNTCTAGYKAIWSKRDGFPRREFFRALHPRMEHIVDEKMKRELSPIGSRAGALTPQMAALTGLRPGIAVAVANVDAHVSVPACKVTRPGTLVSIMGTSVCDMLLDTREAMVEGMCGYVEDGILPGYLGYEAGQSCVGDGFAWFVENCVPPQYFDEARATGRSIHAVLEAHASRLKPGESGLLALDWWNGNRSILVDADLSAVMLGMTLATTAPEMYRAWIEATAFGMRVIVEAFTSKGLAIEEIVACGGLPDKNKLFMQITADVVGLPIRVSASSQTPALGSAMFAAVAAGSAAGGYDSIEAAAERMAHLKDEAFVPNPAHRQVYDQLYAEYVRLHDYFGRDMNSTIKKLKRIKLMSND
ncbi:MAG: ribulokinase [Anaerolineae bacterium]|nr:ribulokinase [Candidatus Roseilinea sp.]MDW8449663.1 ribulokinase [Anaerolineae bacterium]